MPTFGEEGFQLRVTEEEVTFRILGVPGGSGNLEASRGVFELAVFSTTDRVAVQDVSPLDENAVHVYVPMSELLTSIKRGGEFLCF